MGTITRLGALSCFSLYSATRTLLSTAIVTCRNPSIPTNTGSLHNQATNDPSAGQQLSSAGASARHLSHFAAGSSSRCSDHHLLWNQSPATPALLQQVRSLFGAPKAAKNLQIHTHDKYKQIHPQPTYEWMKGRFVIDRNEVIWHKQANFRHKRYAKNTSAMFRLRRLKPLYHTYAVKFKKLGFNLKYWSEPDPQEVPGFHGSTPFKPSRRSAVPDLRDKVGDPALRPH